MRVSLHLTIVLLKFVCSISSDLYSYSEEDIKSPWSAENQSSSLRVNSRYVPKFQLDNVKVHKLKWSDAIGQNALNKSNISLINKTNDTNSASNTKFSKLSASSSKNREKIKSDKSEKDAQLERYLPKPKKGIIYYINAHEHPHNKITTTEKPSLNQYLTREEHERELLLLRKKYELGCNLRLKEKGGSTTQKPQTKKKKKSKTSSIQSDIVDTIGSVLEALYETVADTVTTKVVKKRKSKSTKGPDTKGKRRKMLLQSKVIDASTENDEIFSEEIINNKTKIPTQLEIPQSFHPSDPAKSEKDSAINTNLQIPPNLKTELVPLVLTATPKGKKISKRATPATKLPTPLHKKTNTSQKLQLVNKIVNENLPQNKPTTHVTNEYNDINSTPPKPASSTPMPWKTSEVDSFYDDDLFDFGDIFFDDDDDDDEDYSKEENEDLTDNLSLSSESEGNKYRNNFQKGSKIKKKRQQKIFRKYSFFGIFDYVRDFIKPVRRVIRRLIADTTDLGVSAGIIANDNRKPKRPQNLIYNQESSENFENSVESPIGSWFGSWFSFQEKENFGTDIPTTEEPGWFDSWFGSERKATTPTADYDDENEVWFFNWFNTKPKLEQPTTTTSTSVPILTVSDPMKNPQKWIGILAQHIVNSTAKPPSNLTSDDDVSRKITYENYQMWRLKPNGEEQLNILLDYKNSKEGSMLQWLQGPSLRGLTDVLIPPKLLYDLRSTLDFEGITYEILLFDVGKAMLYEKVKDDIYNSPKLRYPLNWNTYYSYNEILRFLESIRMKNPTLVDIIHIGRSFEGRPLVVVKIAIKQDSSSKKRSKLKKKSQRTEVFVEAGSHGREWIGPASTTWIINEIVKIMNLNDTSSEIGAFKKKTWYIMPVTNPDGYEYSRDYDRMWRKSRSKYNSNSGSLLYTAMTWFKPMQSEKFCYGVDLDRNWDYQWSQQGSSKSPCNELFAGRSALSEPETRSISRFLINHRKQIKLFVSLHSYGQIVSYPNKLNSSYGSQNMDDLNDVAMVGIDGLRKSGSITRYKIDSNGDILSQKSGSADHYAMFEIGIPFSYTIHLGDNGVHGFLVPGSHIQPIAKDAFEILKSMVEYI